MNIIPNWKTYFLNADQVRHYYDYSSSIQKMILRAAERGETSYVDTFFKPHDQPYVKRLISLLNELGYKTSYKRGTRLGKSCQLTISW